MTDDSVASFGASAIRMRYSLLPNRAARNLKTLRDKKIPGRHLLRYRLFSKAMRLHINREYFPTFEK